MKSTFGIILLIGALMVVSARPSDTSADFADLLKQYSSSEKIEAASKNDDQEDLANRVIAELDEDSDDDVLAGVMMGTGIQDMSTDLADLLKQYSSSENAEAATENDIDNHEALVEEMMKHVAESMAEGDDEDDDSDDAIMEAADEDDDDEALVNAVMSHVKASVAELDEEGDEDLNALAMSVRDLGDLDDDALAKSQFLKKLFKKVKKKVKKIIKKGKKIFKKGRKIVKKVIKKGKKIYRKGKKIYRKGKKIFKKGRKIYNKVRKGIRKFTRSPIGKLIKKGVKTYFCGKK